MKKSDVLSLHFYTLFYYLAKVFGQEETKMTRLPFWVMVILYWPAPPNFYQAKRILVENLRGAIRLKSKIYIEI